MNLRSSERQCFRKLQGVSKIKEEEANQVQETGVTSKQWKLGDFYFLLSLLICIFNRELGFLYWGKENNRKVFKEGLSNYWVEIETLIICCFQETNLKQNCTEKSKINVKKKRRAKIYLENTKRARIAKLISDYVDFKASMEQIYFISRKSIIHSEHITDTAGGPDGS